MASDHLNLKVSRYVRKRLKFLALDMDADHRLVLMLAWSMTEVAVADPYLEISAYPSGTGGAVPSARIRL
ncbi:hypothetical protein IBTHAUMO2_70003 [Nitrosopumilaceae archaeon]|nr:hypothetical protein IBTHAUMO2_70003 [Nitrosopumilaceae archaeon]